MTDVAIRFLDLTKRFRRNRSHDLLTALDGLTLDISAGQVFGLLGPNGSGKTTTVNLLCGLLKPTSGRALVHGVEVTTNVDQVRRMLGIVPQETALYNDLTAYENLNFHASLYNVPHREQRSRIAEALELVGLTARKHDRVGTYSGGMQRRLALARALLTQPAVVALDEPTLGVDVQSRAMVWEHVQKIAQSGRTVLLTTNYMEEAQALANNLAFLDHGQLIAQGTPASLRQQLGQTFIDIEADIPPEYRDNLERLPDVTEVTWQDSQLRITASHGSRAMPAILDCLQQAGVTPRSITMREPDLNDVFLSLTGRALRD